jgi:hypothetical protein
VESGTIELERFVRAIERSAAPRAADVAAGLRPETWRSSPSYATRWSGCCRTPSASAPARYAGGYWNRTGAIEVAAEAALQPTSSRKSVHPLVGPAVSRVQASGPR